MEETTTRMSLIFRLKRFSKECYRVLLILKKPNRQEYSTVAKMSALGMGVLGVLGFAIFIIKQLLF